jgi:hypothetical protein
MVEVRGKADSDVEAVKQALVPFAAQHPDAETSLYRYNPASIRIRVVGNVFQSMDHFDRHDFVWRFLEALDEETLEQVTLLLLLTPQEVANGKSMANIEFEDPSPSLL